MTPRKILIVDDDQKIRSLLKTYLEKNQYEVLLAHDGASFMAEFERHRDEISLCILDVMLPDTEGFTLCQSVRRRSEVPVIRLTAGADETEHVVGDLGQQSGPGQVLLPRQVRDRDIGWRGADRGQGPQQPLGVRRHRRCARGLLRSLACAKAKGPLERAGPFFFAGYL